MGKCSEWMLGHDRSKELTVNRPDPNEIEEDIAEIEKYRTELNKRNTTLREQPEKQLKPQASAWIKRRVKISKISSLANDWWA